MLPTIRRSHRPFFMPDLFNDDFFNLLPAGKSTGPAVNIREDEKNFILDLAIPGLNRKDLRIDIDEDILTVSSEKKKENEEENDGYRRREFSYSSFCRSFYIPEDVNQDKIEAVYKDGILSITLPRQEEEKIKKVKEIKIS
jgi:HSP20 family protein